MFTKKVAMFVGSIIAVVALLGTTAATAFAKAPAASEIDATKQLDIVFGKPETLDMGRMGVVMPSSGYTGELDLTRLAPASVKGLEGVKWERPLLQFSVEVKGEEETFSYQRGLTYVFFDLNKQEYKDWTAGKLGLYYLPLGSKDWIKITNAHLSLSDAGVWRVIVVTPGFGTYGLGMPKIEEATPQG